MNLWSISERLIKLIIFIILITSGVNSLEVTRLVVPRQISLGKAALLSCKYSLQGDRLYSLAWLKDGHQFLRVRPGYPTITYPTEGIHLKVEDSNGSLILLWKTDLESEGDYTCEITGEAPRFLTSYKQAHLSIIALPEMGPRIEGGKDHYSPGDRLNLTCISGPSYPPANLTWYINGHLASGEMEVLESEDGLKLATTKLTFEVEPKHLTSGILKVRCLATISNLYWNSSEQPPVANFILDNDVTPSFLSHLSISGDEDCKATVSLTTLILCFSILLMY